MQTDQPFDLYKEVFNTYKEYNGTVVETHINKLKELDEFLPPMESFFIVTNTSTHIFEFVSKNFEYALGLDKEAMVTTGVPYWMSHIHPDDLPIWVKVLEDLMGFTMREVPKEDRHKLSYTWNFRMRTAKADYVNIFEHQTPIYFDTQGKPIVGIAHNSVVGRGEARPIIGVLKILNENNEYETIFYKNYSHKMLDEGISKREYDIIRLLALNYTSTNIAEKLNISSHTVDTHRRNILKKLSFSSTQELVQYCLVNQLF